MRDTLRKCSLRIPSHRSVPLRSSCSMPLRCLLSLLQISGFIASMNLPQRVFRHALGWKPPTFNYTRRLTKIAKKSNSRYCLGWGQSIGCLRDICTKIYIHGLDSVSNSVFTRASMHCILFFILKTTPLSSTWV